MVYCLYTPQKNIYQKNLAKIKQGMMNHKIALVDFLNEDPFFKAVSFILLLLLLLLLLLFLGGRVGGLFSISINFTRVSINSTSCLDLSQYLHIVIILRSN